MKTKHFSFNRNPVARGVTKLAGPFLNFLGTTDPSKMDVQKIHLTLRQPAAPCKSQRDAVARFCFIALQRILQGSMLTLAMRSDF